MSALYRRLDATTYRATELTQGPWNTGAQHGGPPGALIAGAIEDTPGNGGNVARVTIEILAPVPITDLTLTSHIIRPGKRVELVGATLAAGVTPVATATGWRYTADEVDIPPPPAAPESPLPPTESGDRVDKATGRFAREAVEIRYAAGSIDEPGPASAWFRLCVPVIDDHEPSPLQRAVAAADFSNGVGGYLDFNTHLFINTDLTVNLYRTPVGEWIGLTATSQLGRDGRGHAGGPLFDERGPIGRSSQTLLVGIR